MFDLEANTDEESSSKITRFGVFWALFCWPQNFSLFYPEDICLRMSRLLLTAVCLLFCLLKAKLCVNVIICILWQFCAPRDICSKQSNKLQDQNYCCIEFCSCWSDYKCFVSSQNIPKNNPAFKFVSDLKMCDSIISLLAFSETTNTSWSSLVNGSVERWLTRGQIQ